MVKMCYGVLVNGEDVNKYWLSIIMCSGDDEYLGLSTLFIREYYR